MTMFSTTDYKDLGLKAGIEVHGQLRTEMKLFSTSRAILSTSPPDFTVHRRFRPAVGEFGVTDPAMALEHEKGLDVIYHGQNESAGLYEVDETPPLPVNSDALDKAMTIALLFHCYVVDELHVMRKMYVDGSVPSGFQRTGLIGYGGYFELTEKGLTCHPNKRVGLTYVYLEEDAARRESTKGRTVTFKLDRLGYPLVELVTAPDLSTATEVRLAAETLGQILKTSGLVRRGLGTIRQDLNVSVREGGRVELKGVQRLDMIQPAVDNEISRQLALTEIRKQLERRGAPNQVPDIHPCDLTSVVPWEKTEFNQQYDLRGNYCFFFGLRAPCFAGLLGKEVQDGCTLGDEIIDRTKVLTSSKSLIILHSDDLMAAQKLGGEVREEVGHILNLRDNDAFILVFGPEMEVGRAMTHIQERLAAACLGVPEETRRVGEKGHSTYVRDLHGHLRLYPDTDSPIIPISEEHVRSLTMHVPELPNAIVERLMTQHKLSQSMAMQLLDLELVEVFEGAVATGVDRKVALSVLTQTFTELRRQGIPLEVLGPTQLRQLFVGLAENQFTREAIPPILVHWTNHPQLSLEQVITATGVAVITTEQLEAIIQELLKRNKELVQAHGLEATGKLMGLLMKEVRGRVEGKEANERIRRALAEHIGPGGEL